MDVYAQSSATAGGDQPVPVRLDQPRVTEGEADYSNLAEQSRQAAWQHAEQTARQQGNAVN